MLKASKTNSPRVPEKGRVSLYPDENGDWNSINSNGITTPLSTPSVASVGARVALWPTDFSIPDSIPTAVSFMVTTRDDGNFHGPPNYTRLTAPSAGWYDIITSIYALIYAPSSSFSVSIELNGQNTIASKTLYDVSGDNVQLEVSTMFYLQAGDYVEAIVTQYSGQVSGVTRSPNTYFAIRN